MGDPAAHSHLSSSSRIPELDGLRGIAIILVILFHYFFQGTPPPMYNVSLLDHLCLWFRSAAALGWSGVDLFFVLSGFLIGGILLDVRDSPSYYETFYLRRFYRIVPVYYLWLLVYVVLLLTIRQWTVAYSADPFFPSLKDGVLWLFLFVRRVRFDRFLSLGWTWLIPMWSLGVEEQFYLIAPMLVRRLSRRGLTSVLAFVVALAPLLRIYVRSRWPAIGPNWDLAYILMPCRADSLAIGVLLAIFWRTQALRAWISRQLWLLYVLAVIFFAGVVVLGRTPDLTSYPSQSVGYTWFALFYGVALLLVLGSPRGPLALFTRAKWLREIGRLSYCIYLIHFAVWWVFHTSVILVERRPQSWHFIVADLLAVAAVYGIARKSWKNIEYPLLRRASAYQY